MVLTPPLVWLTIAVVLLGLEMLGVDSDGLLLVSAVTALLLCLITSLLALPTAIQGVLFAVVGILGYAWLRHWSGRREARSLPPSAGADRAEVIAGFDAEGRGRVRWQGQSWAALNLQPERALNPGCQVTVLGREGTELRVMPR
jgi:membrane protein implicated in regulation of membrane protease activity